MGWIRKQKSGTFEASYRDPIGRVRSKTFRTKTEARTFLSQVENSKHTGTWIDPNRSRVRFDAWAAQERRTWADLRPATQARGDSLMRSQVLPEFGELPLAAITPLRVQGWINEMVANGLSASTVHGCYRLLGRVMRAAERSEMIASSPCREITLPRIEVKQMLFLEAEELHRLAEGAGQQSTLIYCAGYLGLRWGELAGLRRARLDTKSGDVEVVEILTEVGGQLAMGPPKTKASRRRVSLPAFLVEMLEAHLATRPRDPGALVFVGRDGAPLRRTNFRKRHWQPAVQRAGLPEALRFHDLRHTCASLLIAQGAHPKEIQARLGHSSITTTLDRYGHLFPSLDERLRTGLDATFREAARASSGASVTRIRPQL
jgi:integrase